MTTPISGHEVTRLAVEAEVSPKTVYAALRGKSIRRACATTIRAAAARLGWTDRLPASLATPTPAAE